MEKISPQAALQHLGGRKSVKVYLPTRGTGTLPFEGIAQPVTTSVIKVSFPPDTLPRNIDTAGEFKLAIAEAGPSISVHGYVRQVVNDRQVLLEAVEAYQHPQKREHFRIDVDVPVRYWRYSDEPDYRPEILQSPTERINLSGGGMMFVAEFKVAEGQKLCFELSIPGPPREIVRCEGRVVRVTERGESAWGVAVHFIDLDDEDQETLISYCFSEQRRQLRTKVEVAGR
ncbi:flagellar brake protein [Geoalkalibacter halelectricus]|uniref:PilZ domain-containing protein n=1 Tax=Geoalkalibacter halelectricus TaxID=2847045 RepID=A0ABY5ZH94_9BACT|nr:PilZ domain-containing protein [Geoalkalibacter halelectricus]MDO3377868.1 PilZ domain-containing protein [Geoalkalibacter halelectricus]UWZ77948.1 PilZ domain-containing protein [Geoalkalibacter halelectricus]